jgi:6-phosphofructokinase 1
MGRNFSIVIVAEGARPVGGTQIYTEKPEQSLGSGRLGGVADHVCREVAGLIQQESRVTVLGHLQRGGSPTPFDRALATRFGSTAAHFVAQKKFGMMCALQCNEIKPVPISDAISKTKTVPPDGELVQIARSLGISFGD